MAFAGYSQKGTGETNGVSRQGLNLELLKIEGTIEQIESGPCKYTTGRSISGTHLTVKTQEKLINVHLGPTSEVSQLVTATEGDSIVMRVFRTNKLPQDQYIAKEVKIDGVTTVLRDDALKPVWSDRKRKEKWRTRN
ncbi:hypothetical protein FNH22_27955 [Fulvivirga sp. M361]|uniref:hypothetical protein n=1 Tax=Fulvivirga sp. M361 TaxID=2594266 RepID=UPI00117B94B5|nr:hypothetical protein [Fulvivirga sp. M361]TRX49069.1 hypothetical protein FNH22_27955 [Fulvivirga sp. M361]